MAFTKVTAAGIGTTGTITYTNVSVAGVITATGATFSGNVSVGGTLTYEDVTNVDSVGLITARNGIVINDGGLIVSGVTTVSAGTTSIPSISPSGDGNTGIFFPSADTIAFGEGGAEAARIDSSGRLLVGTNSASYTTTAVFEGNSFSDTGQGQIYLNKGDTTVAADTTIGIIRFGATGDRRGADIRGVGDGTWTADSSHPTSLLFMTTADGAASPTERMRITSAGDVGIGGVTPTRGPLHLHKDGTTNTYIKLTNGVTGSTTADGAEIVVNTSGELLFNNRETQPILFLTQATERARIDSSGRLLVGTSSAYTGYGGSDANKFQIAGNSYTNAAASAFVFGSTTVGAYLNLGLSKNTTIGSHTAVSNNNTLGAITFNGSDGSAFKLGAMIQCDVDGTPGTNNMPSRLMFSTNGGASSATERMRIDSQGFVGIGGVSPTRKLQVHESAAGANSYLSLTNNTTGSAGSDGFQLICSGSDGEAIVMQRENAPMSFYTNGAERMRIRNAGEVLIGSTGYYRSGVHVIQSTANSAVSVISTGTSQSAGTLEIVAPNTTANTSNWLIVASAAGTDRFYVYSNGNVANVNNSYAAISDIKLKENIVNAGSQWDDLKAIQIRKYNFKEETGYETYTQLGVVAQEVELVSPGLVTESPDIDEEGNDLGTVTKSVNYSVLYMKAVKALQEAMERIETLETTNTTQAATIAALDARLTALEGGN